jgi:IS30 family transposase
MARGPLITEAEKQTIRDMAKEGKPLSLIVELTGRHYSTVSKLLRADRLKQAETEAAA